MSLVDRVSRLSSRLALSAVCALAVFGAPGAMAAEVNAYSIWPENWARPMFEEFEKATGIKVNFVRFSGISRARVSSRKLWRAASSVRSAN